MNKQVMMAEGKPGSTLTVWWQFILLFIILGYILDYTIYFHEVCVYFEYMLHCGLCTQGGLPFPCFTKV